MENSDLKRVLEEALIWHQTIQLAQKQMDILLNWLEDKYLGKEEKNEGV